MKKYIVIHEYKCVTLIPPYPSSTLLISLTLLIKKNPFWENILEKNNLSQCF